MLHVPETPVIGLLSLETPAAVVSFWSNEDCADVLSKQLDTFLRGKGPSMIGEFAATEIPYNE
jgi:hypothetical protein